MAKSKRSKEKATLHVDRFSPHFSSTAESVALLSGSIVDIAKQLHSDIAEQYKN